MYMCPYCNNDCFISKTNEYGDQVEECTVCGEQFLDDGEEEEEEYYYEED